MTIIRASDIVSASVQVECGIAFNVLVPRNVEKTLADNDSKHWIAYYRNAVSCWMLTITEEVTE